MKTNKVNTLLPSLPRMKESESNFFQLIIAGSYSKVKRFWKFVKDTSSYRVTIDYQHLFDKGDQKEDLHLVMQIEETCFCISDYQGRESVIQMQTTDGIDIEFSILDVQLVEMLNGMIYVQGKSYDIFANPIRDGREMNVE